MSTKNDDSKPTDNMELLKQQASTCGPGCSCSVAGPSGRIRWIVGTIILVAAATLIARAVMKDKGELSDKAASGFATAQAIGQTSAPDGGTVSATNEALTVSDTVVGKEIGELSELNAVAADMDAVFVFLPGKSEATAKEPTAQIKGAAKTIESQGSKIGLFTLKTDSQDYEQIAAQMAVPGVLAMVNGRGMSAVSGDITETKLIQAFVDASSAGECCGGGSTSCN